MIRFLRNYFLVLKEIGTAEDTKEILTRLFEMGIKSPPEEPEWFWDEEWSQEDIVL